MHLLKYIVLVIFGLMACESRLFQQNNAVAIQGKWRIRQVFVDHFSQRDSFVTDGLGYLVFGQCPKTDNDLGHCQSGLRIYANGKSAAFPFRTFQKSPEHQGQRQLFIATDVNDKAEDLFGKYLIEKLSRRELIFSCSNCYVGYDIRQPMYARFELKAVKE